MSGICQIYVILRHMTGIYIPVIYLPYHDFAGLLMGDQYCGVNRVFQVLTKNSLLVGPFSVFHFRRFSHQILPLVNFIPGDQ